MLSVIIICKNEEKKIKDCLDSVTFADEIIIVDSGSTDTTLDICRNYTEKIYVQDWLGMNKQKAFALTKANYDWVLNIDADERITSSLEKEINYAINDSSANLNGFYIPRKAYYLGKWLKYGGWYPDLNLRLFKKEFARWVGTDPHDKVEVEGETGKLINEMLHFSFDDLAAHWKSNNIYSTIAAQQLAKNKKKVYFHTIILHCFFSFIKSLILKRGYKEGMRGFIQAFMISSGVALKYAKLWELKRKN